MLTKHYDWYLDAKERELFHYTNYKVNPYVTEQKARFIEELKDTDPARYEWAALGMPGVESGGVYGNLMRRVSRILQPYSAVSAGLDYGWKHDPMTVIIIGTDPTKDGSVEVIDEWWVNNQALYSHEQLAERIVNWLIAQATIEPLLLRGLKVICDKSNFTFIEMLNKVAKNKKLDWFSFRRSWQMEVLFRINFKQWLMSYHKLNISLLCKQLWRELQGAVWDDRGTKPKLMAKSEDHMMDALDYALMPWMNRLLRNANPYYFFNKEKEIRNEENEY